MFSKNKNINNKVNNLVHFANLQVDIQKEMKIILTKPYKRSSFLKRYHALYIATIHYATQNGTKEFSG